MSWTLKPLTREHIPAAAALFNQSVADGEMIFSPLDEAVFERRFFQPGAHAFAAEENGELIGFIHGACKTAFLNKENNENTPGYLSVVVVRKDKRRQGVGSALVAALEDAFRAAGKRRAACNDSTPVHMNWTIPGTPGHDHNNAPGVATDLPLHDRMLSLGYRESTRECAMYRNLADYETPAWVEEKAAKMGGEGYRVERYDPRRHVGLEEMVAALDNTMWSEEIPAAGKSGMDLLVGLKGNVCAGFTGPVYPEKTGRGYFAGLGVAPQFEGHGLGTLLFYRLLEREKQAGAKYMSLFTGEVNHARFIYLNAGFRVVRTFGVMLKEL